VVTLASAAPLVAGFVARCIQCRATTPQGRIARPLAATLRMAAPG
jgi:hypothetical protein